MRRRRDWLYHRARRRFRRRRGPGARCGTRFPMLGSPLFSSFVGIFHYWIVGGSTTRRHQLQGDNLSPHRRGVFHEGLGVVHEKNRPSTQHEVDRKKDARARSRRREASSGLFMSVILLAVGVSNIISGTCTNYTPGAGLGPRLARRPSRFRRDGNEDSGP